MSDLYKVILVDDEDDVRGRIISKITEDSGFEVVAKAGNGYDALELIEELNPDAVITDIKMPFINGIELAKILRRDHPTIKIGFISGYDEFDYAREAIELNVISYLMKPITSSDLNEFLLKLKKILDEERDSIKNIDSLNKIYNDSLPKIIQSNLYAFSHKQHLDISDLENLKDLGFNTGLGKYVVATIGLNPVDINNTTILSIKSIISKTFESFDLISSFQNNEGVSFIGGFNAPLENKEIDLLIFEVISYIEEFLQINPVIGISSKFTDFKTFPKAFRESVEAKNHGGYYNVGSVVYFSDIINKEKITIEFDDALLQEFDYAIRFKDETEFNETLYKIKKLLTRDDYIVNHQVALVNIANSLVTFSNMNQEESSKIFGDNLLRTLSSFNTLDELFKWIKDTVLTIRSLNSRTQIDKVERLVNEAFKRIETNYSDSYLSLENVADDLNISVSYLSSLIKKYKNITFNKYLIKVRMEKAQELLKFTGEKILNISKQVGYNEVYYFSHSFKRYTKMTPREYREANKI